MFKILNAVISKPGMKLLLFLSKEPTKTFYLREIVKNCKISLGSAHSYLNKFLGIGLIKREQKGRTILYQLNLENPLVKQLKVLFNLCYLHDVLMKLKMTSSQAIVYGSTAEGTNTSESDIDILIITDRKDKVKGILKNVKNASPLILSYNEWLALKKKDRSLYENIMRGIKLW